MRVIGNVGGSSNLVINSFSEFFKFSDSRNDRFEIFDLVRSSMISFLSLLNDEGGIFNSFRIFLWCSRNSFINIFSAPTPSWLYQVFFFPPKHSSLFHSLSILVSILSSVPQSCSLSESSPIVNLQFKSSWYYKEKDEFNTSRF